MISPISIQAYSAACALGADSRAAANALFSDDPRPVSDTAALIGGRSVPVGRMPILDDADASGACRTNRLVAHLYREIAPAVAAAREAHGPARLGVVIGTSTAGIAEGGRALAARLADGRPIAAQSFDDMQLASPARFAALLAGARGPSYAVSTACTSGARAIASAARLVLAGVADAVLCGGVDTLCDLTLNGFSALDSISDAPCNPMSANRNGITIGEGGALFLLARGDGPHRLAGWGESSDAHHISAPDPEGKGAERALREALAMAGARPADAGFVHLHGTATRLNDAMEARVVHRLFGPETPAASTKALTGHTLGAAGALQAAFCLMALERGRLPPHVWDGERDPELAPVRLVSPGERADRSRLVLSASYAFGGNNAVLALRAA